MRLLRSQIARFTLNVDHITCIYTKNGVRVEGNSILECASRSVLCCDTIDGKVHYLECASPETINFFKDRLEKALVDLNGDKIIDLDVI